MSDVACTALGNDRSDARNPHMVPPCTCPRCTSEAETPHPDQGTWLRVSGRTQRLAVEDVTLGATGQALLG